MATEGSALWVPTPGHDISGLQANSFYGLPPQGQQGSTTQHTLWQELVFIRCFSHLTPWLELLKLSEHQAVFTSIHKLR
nr:unnamed protein product [Digitaria exilis]